MRGTRAAQTLGHAHLLDRIAEHLDTYEGFVAWSGGKDSTAVVDLARRVDPDVPVAFYHSGLEFPETTSYISELADRWNLDLTVIPAEPDLLTMLVAAGSFDHSAPSHTLGFRMHDRLVLEPAARAHEMFGIGSMWGVRAAESAGRRQLYRAALADELAAHCPAGCCGPDAAAASRPRRHGGVVRRSDGTVTFGPIWNWSTSQVLEYLAAREIAPNPLYRKLVALGVDELTARVDAILDANRLDGGAVTRLQRGWPDLFDRLCGALPRLRDYA